LLARARATAIARAIVIARTSEDDGSKDSGKGNNRRSSNRRIGINIDSGNIDSDDKE